MTVKTLILSQVLILLSFFSYSQEITQKGYYSIDKNAKKLSLTNTDSSDEADTANVFQRQRPAKGYYSIRNNKDGLSKAQNKVVLKRGKALQPKLRPVIFKGYYSIGRNADKLR